MDIALVLDKLVPDGDWQGSVTDNTKKAFDNIWWADDRSKPTWEEAQANWVRIENETQWEEIRLKRNELLLRSDYTQLGDVSLSIRIAISAWEKYRQALRDIPQDFTNPKEVIWPEKPKEPYNGENI